MEASKNIVYLVLLSEAEGCVAVEESAFSALGLATGVVGAAVGAFDAVDAALFESFSGTADFVASGLIPVVDVPVDVFAACVVVEFFAGSELVEVLELTLLELSAGLASAGTLAPAVVFPFTLLASSAIAGPENSANIIISEKIRIKTSISLVE